jgi:hypothetical protein
MEPMKPMKSMEPMRPLQFSEAARWWPEALGQPAAAGSQNDVHYAYFRGARRLLLRQGDDVATYDTADHEISGVAQASDTRHARFTSNLGEVDLDSLQRL